MQMDCNVDELQVKTQAHGRQGAHAQHPKPYSRPHGDAKPQEPPFHKTWSLKKDQPTMVQHPHQRPFSMSCCPGKKETAEGQNPFHRVWLMEHGQRGRWNKKAKNEFYKKQDQEMMSKVPHDHKFCRSDGVYKFWTHLQDGGLKAGGQEKLDYTYRGPNSNTIHFYLGKYDNVKHVQRIVRTGWKDPQTEERRALHRDTRPMFDNRLHDDVIYASDQEDIRHYQTANDIFRPKKTASLPQLGADHLYRS